jgi:uncharacterized protein
MRAGLPVNRHSSHVDTVGGGLYTPPTQGIHMRLYSAKIPIIARDIVGELADAGDIEVGNREEAELDIQAVLKEYLRTDRELTEKAKDLMEQRGLPREQFGKLKRAVADDKGFGLGEESQVWIANQILETFMHSQWVDEVFADDTELRKKMKVIIRRHMLVDEEIDGEVRQRIKNLQEGSTAWDVEYSKVMEQIKAKRGLKE